MATLTVTARDAGGRTATRSVPVTVSRTTAPLYGVSHGPNAAAWAEGRALPPQLVRTYQPGQLTDAVGFGRPVHHSMKPSASGMAARSATTIAGVVAEFRRLLDLPGQMATVHHEFDNNGGADTPSVYQAMWACFLDDCLPQINQGRAHPIVGCPITTPVPYFDGVMDDWYVPGAPIIGTDAYSTLGVRLARDYAAAKGKPWCLPEYGYSAAVEGTDAQCVARIRTDHAVWTAGRPPVNVQWFNHLTTAFTQGTTPRPQTYELWRRLCTTGRLD